MTTALLDATQQLLRACQPHRFSAPVTHVYYPLQYAWQNHAEYIQRYGGGRKRAIFLGMNPGPYGMAQTGIPFGDVVSVRDYLGINGAVSVPDDTHPKRPVQGMECPRIEVSGSRLWRMFAARYGSAEAFFADYFVINYCPLLFLRASAANLTPDKLPAAETAPLYRCCDAFLQQAVDILQPELLIGVGGFAEKRLTQLFANRQGCDIGRILHPSPASPTANRGFDAAANKQLEQLGL